MKISVVIVSYKAKTHLKQCLYAVRDALKHVDGEIIVVDNDSQDGMVDEFSILFPEVKIIGLKENVGFAKANNLGVQEAKGEYVLILNPDTVMGEDFLKRIVDFADSKKDFGAVGVRMVNANGKFHPESKRNVPNPKSAFNKLYHKFGGSEKNMTRDYYKTDIGENETAPVEILSGACMLIPCSLYKQLGGFDETYFMYGEDIDLSYTLLQNGYTNYYKGDLILLHYKGESTVKDEVYLERFFGAMQIFLRKYYKPKSWLLYQVLSVGIKVRHKLALRHLQSDRKNETINTIEQSQLVPWDKNNNESNYFLLNGSEYSTQQMLQILTHNYKKGREFFIRPKNMNVIIGDGKLFQTEENATS